MKEKLKVIISGVGGRMGKEILQLVLESDDWELVGTLERPGHSLLGKEISPGVVVGEKLDAGIGAAEVIVDFSAPQATLGKLPTVAQHKKPLVLGTTGFSEEQKERIAGLARVVPVVFAPNMNVGVNVLFALLKQASRLLPQAEVEIVEYHHNQKKDAPSGTALRLAEIIGKSRTEKPIQFVYGRQGVSGPRKPEEVGISAVRAGDIVGEHQVILALPGERLELVHRAHSRRTFAYGALVAARWVVGKPPGLYSMHDVLGLGDVGN